MKENFSVIGLKEESRGDLDKKISRDLNHHWRNLINLVGAFIEITQKKEFL